MRLVRGMQTEGLKVIKSIEQTCWACPSSWDIEMENGTELHVRYRWGKFKVMQGKAVIFQKEFGASHGGYMKERMMLELLKEGGITNGEDE